MFRTPSAIAIVLFVFATTALLHAQDADSEEEEDEFLELVEDAEHFPGFVDAYKKDDHLYLAIEEAHLGREFLLTSQIARGFGSGMVNGGLMLDALLGSKMVAFEKHDGKIFLVQRPDRYVAEPGSPEEASVELTFGSSVLQSGDIEASSGDSVHAVDVYDWFVGDLFNVASRVKHAFSTKPGRPGRASFDKSRSHLEGVKGFPDNLNVTAKLTFKPGEAMTVRGVPDSRFAPVSIHYGLVRLPEEPMQTRIGDDRVGYFLTVRKNFSDDERTFFDRYVWRWRLECAGEPDFEGLCDPVEPITYYIDRTVPEAYRQAMIDGVEAWNDAFEEAGFRQAIRASMLPDTADAADVRYATLRWNVSDVPSYGAIGPSLKDPRTGEILDADILFEANMVLGMKHTWRRLADPSTTIESMLSASDEELGHMAAGGEAAVFATEMVTQANLARATMVRSGAIAAGDPVPDDFVDEVVKWITMHEVGHTLGLRHNFRSSADTPLDLLHDTDWTAENGVFSSVMDYPTINLSAAGEPNGHYYNTGVGSYDRWAIAYGYTPDEDRAAELARQSAQPGHAYGTDSDARGKGAIDPTVNLWDLGQDPLGWGKQRVELVEGLWSEVPEIALADNEPYYEATTTLRTLLNAHAGALTTAVKYIGGQYQWKDHVGDPNGRPPFEPVTPEQQREALAFLIDNAFAEDAFSVPQDVIQQLGAYRWFHWGSVTTVNDRIDYPLHETIVNVQKTLLNRVTDPFVFARILDAEHKFGAEGVLGIPELMSSLSEAIWAEAWLAPGRNVVSTRRNLQRAHIDRLTEIVTSAPKRTPSDARSVARLTLDDLSERLTRRLSPPYSFDEYTLAHYKESLARIERALEAGLDLSN